MVPLTLTIRSFSKNVPRYQEMRFQHQLDGVEGNSGALQESYARSRRSFVKIHAGHDGRVVTIVVAIVIDNTVPTGEILLGVA